MNTAKLNLLACPAVLGFILLGPHLAHATEIAAKPTNSIAGYYLEFIKSTTSLYACVAVISMEDHYLHKDLKHVKNC